jgi:glutamate-ammonia-ligase adenylyltransferase
VEAYEAYYWTRAQLWEIQSLTRARVVCGPRGSEFMEVAQRAWRTAGERADLLPLIDAMRERIRRDRGTGAEVLDYKTGLGGIIEAEFLIQALQMRAGVREPQFTAALIELMKRSIVSAADGEAIQASYDFLRRCESVLRRFENKSVSALPNSEFEQAKLARRLGEKDLELFGARYRSAREVIHAAYERYMR